MKQFMVNPSVHLAKLTKDKKPDLPTRVEVTDYLETTAEKSQNFTWQKIKWMDVKQGQYLLIRNDEAIPADVVVISSSEPDSLCFVETKNLDGETNLKVKRGFPDLAHVKTAEDCAALLGSIEAGPPSEKMYEFNGRIKARIPEEDCTLVLNENKPSLESTYKDLVLPVDINNLLLRGCILRNTRWVIALVISVGSSTKLMLNSGKTPSKKSRIDMQLNTQVSLVANLGAVKSDDTRYDLFDLRCLRTILPASTKFLYLYLSAIWKRYHFNHR